MSQDQRESSNVRCKFFLQRKCYGNARGSCVNDNIGFTLSPCEKHSSVYLRCARQSFSVMRPLSVSMMVLTTSLLADCCPQILSGMSCAERKNEQAERKYPTNVITDSAPKTLVQAYTMLPVHVSPCADPSSGQRCARTRNVHTGLCAWEHISRHPDVIC